MDTKDNTKIQKDIKEPDNQKWWVKTTMEEATIKDNNKVIEVITITVVEDKEDKEVKEVVIEEVIEVEIEEEIEVVIEVDKMKDTD